MTTHLTDTQKQTIRIALAKFDGHTNIQWFGRHLISDRIDPHPDITFRDVPNYPADLNACHEIEVKLNFSQRLKFHKELQKIESGEFNGALLVDYRECISAKAEHRSLALFRALNLGELGD